MTSSRPSVVVKRNGVVAPFDSGKIRSAIERAGRASGEFDAARAAELTAQAEKVLKHRFAS
ncbi:anaerobic ribonucleoside-triphosphate reductase [Rhodoblastus sphagnicola]|nr:anaerobic ribonucleoside-triphosphate reductase [Rhodoblastus sphagnicola]